MNKFVLLAEQQKELTIYEALTRDLGVFGMGESTEAREDINLNNFTRSYSLLNNDEGKMKDEMGTSSGITIGGSQKLPGAWFYEDVDEMSCSPVSDIDEATNFVNLHASQEVRNVTQSVEVPSSEHVAEIVGRQGCKIKALRAKTNTYIKTPIRGEEPIFVVTGRPDDVDEAKYEIECAAEHFTQIRASRKHTQAATGNTQTAGHVTTYVRVPLRVVGLVVGPKGATIKRIQQDTHTYIITPSREREPIFEVTGMPSNVDAARKEIEQHIYQRTGNMPITDPPNGFSQFSNGLPMNMANAHSVIPPPPPPPPQSRFVGPQFAQQMPMPNRDYRPTEFPLRQLGHEIDYNALLRSFPSMRSSLPGNNMWGTKTPSPTPTPATMKQLNLYKLMKAAADGNVDAQEMWSNSSLGDMIDHDMYSRNMDAFGRQVWSSSSLGIDGKDDKRDDSPTNGLISLNGCGPGFGNLQSIWSDVRSSTSASLNSASASPSSSPMNCENEKTLCVGASLSDILTM